MAKIPVAQEQAAIYVQKDGYTLTLRQCRFPGGQDRFLTPLSSSKVQFIFSMSCTLYLITVNISAPIRQEKCKMSITAKNAGRAGSV